MKVYASFSTDGSAEAAENEVRSRISGFTNISRTVPGSPKSNAVSGSVGAHADWMFTPNGLFQGASWLPLEHSASDYKHHSGSCTICIEGDRDCVDRTARLLRSLGGTNVNVTAD